MKIILSADDVLLDTSLSPVPDAAFLLGQLIENGHEIAVIITRLNMEEAFMRGKALREHFPMVALNQIFIAENAGRIPGDVVVSTNQNDFSAKRKQNILLQTNPISFEENQETRIECVQDLYGVEALISIFETAEQMLEQH